MLTFTDAQVLAWITPILWPFLRVLALFSALPVFAQRGVPMRVRVALAFLIAFCAQATLPEMPVIPLDSAPAVLAIAGPWMLTSLVEFLQRTLQSIPTVVG